jgi:hypothetical protein
MPHLPSAVNAAIFRQANPRTQRVQSAQGPVARLQGAWLDVGPGDPGRQREQAGGQQHERKQRDAEK